MEENYASSSCRPSSHRFSQEVSSTDMNTTDGNATNYEQMPFRMIKLWVKWMLSSPVG